KPGDSVRAGEPLLTLHTDDADRIPRALEALSDAWTIGATSSAAALPLVIDRVA
ncbi:MAG TPA: thymidine phosphorylase, partial [Actinomycetes bacterium]|nr:thymidine phosphorylase [Actinomycetes bacterium]